jgi:hypothetical protein
MSNTSTVKCSGCRGNDIRVEHHSSRTDALDRYARLYCLGLAPSVCEHDEGFRVCHPLAEKASAANFLMA